MPKVASRKRITLGDVADKAGVSPSAVSVALSRRSGTTSLRPVTRERILKAAHQLDYKPDMRARGLVTRRSYLIALLARETFEQYVVGISQGIDREIRDHAYSLLSYTAGGQAQDEANHLSLSLDRSIDGLIVMPALDPDGRTNADHFASLKKEGMPIVQLFGHVLADIPSVRRDHAGGARLAVDHLLELGHRRIVHVTHDRADPLRDPHDAHVDARNIREAYEDRMEEAGLTPHVATHTVPLRGRLEYADKGEEVADAVLQPSDRPTAVVAYNDYQAIGLMHACRRRGVHVPDDLSIVGAGDLDAARLAFPALTSIRYPIEQIGAQAAGMLMTLLDGEKISDDRVVDATLCPRQSSGPPPRSR